VPRHRFKVCPGPELQPLRRERTHRPSGPIFIILHTRRGENQVGVTIHETRHHHPSGRVDLNRVPGVGQVLQAAAGTNLHDDAVPNQDGPIRYYTEIFRGLTTTWTMAAAQGQQLARAPDK
jgi:hypothetical protein